MRGSTGSGERRSVGRGELIWVKEKRGTIFMNKKDVHKMFKNQTVEQQNIREIIQKTKDDEAKVKVELEELNEKLSYLLADYALGKIPKPEITKAKKRRDKLQEIILDAPLLLKGLNRLRVISI